LRIFDLRSAVPATINIATKVYGIATSPIDPHQIACCGDGIITVWDARRLLHPLLTSTEKGAAADGARPRAGSFVNHIEFSSSRRGVLAAHEKDSSYVRFWDLQQAHGSENSSDGERSGESSQSRAAKRSWAPWTAGGAGAGNGIRHHNVEWQEALPLVLSDTRKSMFWFIGLVCADASF
jgi:WD40 repeat protein